MTKLEQLLCTGDRYIKQMDVVDMAALKFCLSSMGVLLGLGVSSRMKRPVGLLAACLFVGTYIPLMSRFVMLHRQGERPCPPPPAEEEG